MPQRYYTIGHVKEVQFEILGDQKYAGMTFKSGENYTQKQHGQHLNDHASDDGSQGRDPSSSAFPMIMAEQLGYTQMPS